MDQRQVRLLEDGIVLFDRGLNQLRMQLGRFIHQLRGYLDFIKLRTQLLVVPKERLHSHDIDEPLGQPVSHLRDLAGLLFDDEVQHLREADLGERRNAAQHVVQRRAEPVDVRAGVGVLWIFEG